MSVLDVVARVAGFERAFPVEVKQVDAPYSWPVWNNDRPDWTQPTLANYAAEGYQANAVIYSCISRKAESAAMAPLAGYQGDRKQPEQLGDEHPLTKLLRRPNDTMSWYEFQELLIVYLELDGNAFIYKARPSPRRPVEALYPLRSDRVRPVPKGGKLLGFVYDHEDGTQPTAYPAGDIIHIKYPNPLDTFEGLGRGRSPLMAAARSGDLDNQNTTFLWQFFQNAVVPFGLLKSKQKLMDTDIQRIKERLKAQYSGERNWHEIMILDADAEYQRLGLTMQELDFGTLDARNEARICAVLKVPPIIAGARIGIEHMTYANYAEARLAFWEDGLIPGVYQRFEDGWNAHLAAEFPGVWLTYDYSGVPALRENENEVWDRAIRAFMSGVAMRNEARSLVHLDPVPDEQDGFRKAQEQQLSSPAVGKTPVDVGDGTDELEADADEPDPEDEMDDQEETEETPQRRQGGKAAEAPFLIRWEYP